MRSRTLISFTIGNLIVGFAATSALGLMTAPALGQPQSEASKSESPSTLPVNIGPILFKAQGRDDSQAWLKHCMKPQNEEICLVSNEHIDLNSGTVLVGIAVRKFEGEAKEHFVVTLPLAALLSIPAGVQVSVDGAKPELLGYSHCYGTTCEAQTELTKDLLSKLRKGNKLTVAFVNLKGQAFSLPVDLTGFAKSYDGPSTDTAYYLEARNRVIAQRQAEFAAQAESSQAAPSVGEGPSPSQPKPVYPDGPYVEGERNSNSPR